MKPYKFLKNNNQWFIDLPEYIAQGGNIADLQMVDGADKMLDLMAENKNSVTVYVAKDYFIGAEKLNLIEKCDPSIGGGNYLMKYFNGNEINQTIWLCQVTEFVFGDLPQDIFVMKHID